MFSTNHLLPRPSPRSGLRRGGGHFVVGALSSLAHDADSLQQELTELKQEIAEIEDRLKNVAERWEYRRLPRSF